MPNREKVVEWLTEISLRPCDFATDYFDAYETEHLANEALEICEDAKVFNQQRNDALVLLKEQDKNQRKIDKLQAKISDLNHRFLEKTQIVRCKDCKHFHEFEPSEFCKRIFHEETRYECWNPRLTDQDNVPTKGQDWFCADGERKEGQ